MKNEWLKSAHEDLTMARLALEADLTASAAFHVQQGMEKAFKALLVERNQRPPHIHDLEVLSRLSAGSAAPFTPEDLADISAWVTSGRYPNADDGPPDASRIRDVLSRAQNWFSGLT